MDLLAATPGTFIPHRGSSFRVLDIDGLELRLEDVEVFALQPDAPRPEPFTLVFGGPREPRLAQGIARLDHAELGDLEIFLVPIGYGADGGLIYEAVFN